MSEHSWAVLYCVLLLAGFMCFAWASRRHTTKPFDLLPLGLALWVAVPLLAELRVLL